MPFRHYDGFRKIIGIPKVHWRASTHPTVLFFAGQILSGFFRHILLEASHEKAFRAWYLCLVGMGIIAKTWQRLVRARYLGGDISHLEPRFAAAEIPAQQLIVRGMLDKDRVPPPPDIREKIWWMEPRAIGDASDLGSVVPALRATKIPKVLEYAIEQVEVLEESIRKGANLLVLADDERRAWHELYVAKVNGHDIGELLERLNQVADAVDAMW